MNPLQFIDENKELLFQTYHDLHHLAEPSWEERKTSKYLRPHFEVPFMMASPCSIKMTQLQTDNTASNVIPETATFTIDARAQSNEIMDELKKWTEVIIERTMEHTGASISWSLEELVPAATLHKKATRFVESAITHIHGEDMCFSTCVSQGGEDFHFYTAKNPE
ncbi:peptidase dimerization domain-containing protein [Neobacillus drentensis]|uniref:peptidase dimerization domain-containing protein n=1 Tax=Neobacillus drentensis TaxID=220684 RepID=UPI002FFE0485